MIELRLGIRNLLRARWRSGLTLAGVAVAVGLLVWTLAFYEGWIAVMIRGATAVETGQVQIHTAGWVESPRVYRSFPVDAGFVDRVVGVPGVEAASPRIEGYGLIGNEARSQTGRLLGVDPDLEAATTPTDEAVESGRWLASAPAPEGRPREVVLGADLARNLGVDVGAELVVFLEAADGSLGNDLLEVVGTVRTGNTALDRTTAFIHLDDARRITALEGRANLVVVRATDLDAARETARAVANALGLRYGTLPEAEVLDEDVVVVRPWQEVSPTLDEMILLVRRSYWFVYLIVYLVAALGILNTQRMSALERRREFGVLIALGIRPRRMFRILQTETVVLGTAGAVLGALLGGLLAWYHATVGFDMSALSSQASFSYMGIAFTERIHFVLGPTALLQPLVVMLGVALLSGLWPALSVARIEPAPTIAGRTG